MLKKIVYVAVVLAAALVALIAMQPTNFRVSRSATISAPPGEVFGLVNNFHKWDTWSPWAKLDPAMKTAYEGPPEGTGAIYRWAGDSKVGEGAMTILESRANELVRIKLDFIKPFAMTNSSEFVMKPASDGVNVEWTMTGENKFINKAFGLFMGGMDKMIGPDFEKGLSQMKTVAEAASRR